MAQKRDLKKHFEAILDRELSGPEDGVVVLRDFVASYTRDDGATTSRDIGSSGDLTKDCSNASLLDVSGTARTGRPGTVEFMLSEFFCDFSGPGSKIIFDFPANLVATPRSERPIFLTAVALPTNDRRDVRVKVSAFLAPRALPARNLLFDWRCRVPYHLEVD